MTEWDVAIIGGGVAGMTAGLYCAHHGLKTLVLERMLPCSQIANVERIENFPGFSAGLSGSKLGSVIHEQVVNAGAQVEMTQAERIRRDDPYRAICTAEGEYRAKAVIVAVGSTLRRLGVPGERDLVGRGVSQCATCDGPLFQGKAVAVVGGGDSAADAALTLTSHAARIYLLHRGKELRAQARLRKCIQSSRSIQVCARSAVERVLGQDLVSGVEVRHLDTGVPRVLDVTGLFVLVGLTPNTEVLNGLIKLDEAGHVPVNLWMETELPGIYAAGDVRQHSARQLVSAAGDGATAAIAAYRYISGCSW